MLMCHMVRTECVFPILLTVLHVEWLHGVLVHCRAPPLMTRGSVGDSVIAAAVAVVLSVAANVPRHSPSPRQ